MLARAPGLASMAEKGKLFAWKPQHYVSNGQSINHIIHRVELHPGDYVTVSASRYPFANVLPQGRRGEDWVHNISKTLNWNSRQKQKSFK